eukprot:gene8049-5796_t
MVAICAEISQDHVTLVSVAAAVTMARCGDCQILATSILELIPPHLESSPAFGLLTSLRIKVHH